MSERSLSIRTVRLRVAACLAVLALSIGVPQFCSALQGEQNAQTEEVVSFNVKSHKYHCRTCTWAKRCTANCIEVPVS